MKNILLLTKILFKSSLNKNSSKNENKVGKIILYVLVYGYIAGFIAYISYACVSSLMLFNAQSLFLELCFSGIITLGIIQTLFSSLNLLFFSKDVENLLPLPISPIKIIMSKFNCLILAQYFTVAVFLIPALITYGVLVNCEFSFYLMRNNSNNIITNCTCCNCIIISYFCYEIY